MYRGVLLCGDFEKYGYLIPEECKFEESRVEFDDYVFTPTFFNAHTHLGDSAFKEAPRMKLEELVGPGGYKHKMLESANPNLLRECALHETLIARKQGTSHFLDFREGGRKGLAIVDGVPGVLPLARPTSLEEAEEMDPFGYAMSSVRDHDMGLIEGIRKIAKRKGKPFAIHAGERDCDDVDEAISLEPDLIVHMNFCPEKLKTLFEAEIPLVSCFRSNSFFEKINLESYRKMKDYEFWLIGTDNAMIASPSILDEMHFGAYLVGDDLAVFKAAVRGYEIFGVKGGYVVFHRNANFKKTNNLLATLVRRATYLDIETVVI